MRLLRGISALAFTVVASCATTRLPPSPFVAEACPLPAHARSYLIVARGDSTVVDQGYLRGLAAMVASAWRNPANKTHREVPQRDTAVLDLAPEDRYSRDGWHPLTSHVARVSFTVHRDGSFSKPVLQDSVADAAFARVVRATVNEVGAARHPWRLARDSAVRSLALPSGVDSTVVTLDFGGEPKRGETTFARLAIQETPARPVGRVAPYYPDVLRAAGVEGDVLAQFIVDTAGKAVPGSVRILRTANVLFSEAILEVIPKSIFLPTVRDCRRQAVLVQWPFQFRLAERAAISPADRRP